ncbi:MULTISPECIES: hypothetical protein [unclassified Shewanella]|uniref:hypothetical protein n=1 Tax=unclassified Shewanella TaxID=196818 RepID=UPI001BBE1420|nr:MULTISPECIES: hypothetical protein [unclassified Shewanella]GIU09069.1 hypothetical protein TUM4444_11140 [Shewanella sp. MBTL60-112-B1]GIU28910.1 hypothetical protein TUM4445_10590 [Shewanella sp. MBTL60-112-B2]
MNKFIKSLFSRSADPKAAAATSKPACQHEYSFQHYRLYYDGLIQLQVVKQGDFHVELHSQFELLGSHNCELILAQWLDDERFIAVDSTGQIYSALFNAADSSKVSLSAITSLELYPTESACISNGQLWIVGAKQGGRRSAKSLFCVDIASALLRANKRLEKSNDFELKTAAITRYEMPFNFVKGSMVCVQGTEFVFYQREKRRMHQLVSFNPITAETQVYPLQGKPAPEEISVRSTFFMDKNHGVALLANTETLSLLEASDENYQFDFELQLIDFNQKKMMWSRKVRALEPSQICANYQVEELIESLTAIAAGSTSSSHHDELQTFIECLTSATISADGNSIWLGWQDGVIQQLSLTGESILPLYKLMQDSSNGKQRSLQVFAHEPVVIKGQVDQQLIVAVGEDEDARIWQMELADKQRACSIKQAESHPITASEYQNSNESLNASQEGSPANSLVSVTCQQVDFSLVMPSRLTEVPTSNGQIDICLEDVNDTAAKVGSLEKLNALMPKLEAHYLKSGQTSLFFSFVNQQLNDCVTQSEYDLFASAAYNEKGVELLASIIKQFASWKCAADLSGLKGAPIMADAVLGLADKRQYLATLAEYFIAIGAQEPIHPFHVNRTMKVIREVHAGTPELADFMAKVPWPWNDDSFTVPNVGDYD